MDLKNKESEIEKLKRDLKTMAQAWKDALDEIKRLKDQLNDK